MAKGILHLHVTVVVLFMIFFGYKLFLLLANKNAALAGFRQKTKIVDMILGSLVLLTGGFLMYSLSLTEPYIIGKIVLTFVAIPLGIVGMKKENKVLSVLTLLIFIYNFGVAETNSLTFKKEKITIATDSAVVADTVANASVSSDAILDQNTEAVLKNGEAIYVQVCAACHGSDGTLGASGAKDLSKSTLAHEEVLHIISEGKGLMQPFEGLLTEQEIAAVALYAEGLRKK